MSVGLLPPQEAPKFFDIRHWMQIDGESCCSRGLYEPEDQVLALDQVFNEDTIATKLSRKNGSVGSKNQSVRFWCKSFLIKRRKKCARMIL